MTPVFGSIYDIYVDRSRYARTFFVGAENEEGAAAALLGLEKNWIGVAQRNGGVAETKRLWEGVGGGESSWRRDIHLFRATVDAYVHAREESELSGEAAARAALAATGSGHTALAAIAAAEAALTNSSGFGEKTTQGRTLKAELQRLFQAINASAALCPGCTSGGGAATISSQSRTLNLQNIDSPLSNAPWLLQQLAGVKSLPSESSQLKAIAGLTSPTWPIVDFPEGSFYDWVGSNDPADRPHLLMGEGVKTDPMHYHTPLLSGSGCTGRHYLPGSAQTLACLASVPLKRMSKVGVSQDSQLQMQWEALDRTAQYTIHLALPGPLTHDAYGSETKSAHKQSAVACDILYRCVLTGCLCMRGYSHGNDNFIRLWAGSTLIYGPAVPINVTLLSFKVPQNETTGGVLRFSCDTVGSPILGKMFQFLFGSDCKLSEVWLVKERPPALDLYPHQTDGDARRRSMKTEDEDDQAAAMGGGDAGISSGFLSGATRLNKLPWPWSWDEPAHTLTVRHYTLQTTLFLPASLVLALTVGCFWSCRVGYSGARAHG